MLYSTYTTMPLLKPNSLSLRWIEKVNLKVRATCVHPPELRGRRVKDVHVFKACPGGESLPSAPLPKVSKPPKSTKPKPAHLNAPRQVKVVKTKTKARKIQTPKPTVSKKTTKRSMVV